MLKKLEDVYAKLPPIACKGLCHDSCGVIPIAPIEREEIAKFTGKKVKVEPLIVLGLHSKHRVLRPKDPTDLTCPYLKKERCSIYPARPLICRMYGVVSGMPCPHGCKPVLASPLNNEQAHDIIEEVANIK